MIIIIMIIIKQKATLPSEIIIISINIMIINVVIVVMFIDR